MQKKMLCLALALLAAALLALGVMAAEAVVYVETGSTEAVGSFADAVAALDGKGGTIVLRNAVFVDAAVTVPEQTGDLTVTAEDGGMLVLLADLVFAKNTNDNVITLDAPIRAGKTAEIFGGFNSVHFTENFSVDGTLDFFGGVDVETAPSGNANNPISKKNLNAHAVTELPYTVTVDGGTFRHFAGGNKRDVSTDFIGSIAAPITLTVNGGTFGTGVSYAADSALKNDRAFSISGNSILADDATLTVNGGVFNVPVYAQGYMGESGSVASGSSQLVNSDAKYYAIDGDIDITLNGGVFNGCEINAFQNSAGLTQLVRGNYTLSIADAVTLADGIVLDATQVKAYDGVTDKKATLNYKGDAKVVRFDVVNGESVAYEEPIRIVCIGDSITQGVGSTSTSVYPASYPKSVAHPAETHSYPAQLLQKIYAEGNTDVLLGNYGHSASKVMNYSGLGYHNMLFYKLSLHETDADYYIIGLGINDAKSTSYTYGMCERFESEYSALLAEYAALPDTVTVFGTTALYAPNADVPGASVRAMQKHAMEELAADGAKVKVLDLYALTLEDAFVGKLLSGDALHPNSDGYTTYANAIYNAVFGGKTAVENFEMSDIWVSDSGTESGAGTKEDPISIMGIAFAKAAPGATIHVVGTFTRDKTNDARWGFQTPMYADGITIVGEGTDATLLLKTNHMHIKSDITFDNITVKCDGDETVYFACGYNNVTFTETFKTPKGRFVAGMVALGEDKANVWYNSRESISSDKDCVINVNGGTYQYFLCGNYLFSGYKPSIYGTYSGNMTINLGPNAVLNGTGIKGAAGQSYLTGTVTLNAATWANGYIIRPYGDTGNVNEKYIASNNTGTVTVNTLETCPSVAYEIGDLNADHSVNVADVLLMLDYVLNGAPSDVIASDSPYYYGITEFSLRDVMHMLYLVTR